MYWMNKETIKQAKADGLIRNGKLTRRCPHCGAELFWEHDESGKYIAMDYDKEEHTPHILTCKARITV